MDTLDIVLELKQELKDYDNQRVQFLLNALYEGFNRIDKVVIPKELKRGARGAYYYENSRGKRTYLNERQLKRFRQENLIGCIGEHCDFDSLPRADQLRVERYLAKHQNRRYQ